MLSVAEGVTISTSVVQDSHLSSDVSGSRRACRVRIVPVRSVLSTTVGATKGIRSPEYSLQLRAICAAVLGNNSGDIFGAVPKKVVILIAAI